jgi:hypothetical protein
MVVVEFQASTIDGYAEIRAEGLFGRCCAQDGRSPLADFA